MKQKIKSVILFITNPRLLLCVAIAWMITNGWSYVLFFVGTYYGIAWLASFSGAYLAFLWLPVSPEKILTFAIAIFLLRIIFPNDKKTLAVLKRLDQSVRDKYIRRRERKKGKQKDKE